MEIQKEKEGGRILLHVIGELSMETAGTLASQLLSELEAEKEIVVDFSRLVECDYVGLQLLISARCTAEKIGAGLKITAMSDPIRKQFDRLGFQTEN